MNLAVGRFDRHVHRDDIHDDDVIDRHVFVWIAAVFSTARVGRSRVVDGLTRVIEELRVFGTAARSECSTTHDAQDK